MGTGALLSAARHKVPVPMCSVLNRYDYISIVLKNPDAADRIVDEVFTAIDKRLPIADRFKKYEFTHEFHYDYYKINVRNFMIFYVVKEDDPSQKIMEIRRIIYNRRDLQRII